MHLRRRALRLLFATSFSEGCERAAGAVVHLAAGGRADVTVVHAARSGAAAARASRELDRVLAAIDSRGVCRPILVESTDAAASIAGICLADRFDLVMAPASTRAGIGRLLSRSFRARLLRQCNVPLWTAGAHALSTASRPIQTVACLMDFDNDRAPFVQLVQSFAARYGARLHFLYVVTPIDESTLTHALVSQAPLTPSLALKRIRDMFPPDDVPQIDVAVGDRGGELRRMLARCQADILFVGPRHASATAWALRFSRDLDRLPCPVVCIDGAASGFARWPFQEREPPVRPAEAHDYDSVPVASGAARG